jgi:hypothetical protein
LFVISTDVWHKIHLQAPDFAQLFATETDGRSDRHAVLLDTIHEAPLFVRVAAE